MSVAAIQARISAIQAQFSVASNVPVAATRAAAVGAPAPATPADSATAAEPVSFADLLAEAEAQGATSGASNAKWTEKLPAEGRPWARHIDEAARSAGIDPRIVAAVAWTESGFRPDAVSGAGARGLMQLMPGTAAGLGVDPDDPRQSLAGGARYLAQQIQRFGRVDLALAAYNAGPGAVQRHGGIPPYSETRAYVSRVMDRLRSL